MTILESDIKLMASERLTDDPDGGGFMTLNEIVDGEANNVFPDISRLDRVYGNVRLRKVFGSIQTPTVDTYHGSHAIITESPEDPKVAILLFETESHSDERAAAQNQIEAYVTRGPTTHWWLYDNHLSGQRAIQVFQRPELSMPQVGQVLYLVENENEVDEYGEYVRVLSVEYEDQTFNLGAPCGQFVRRVVTLELSNALTNNYTGSTIDCQDDVSPTTKLRSTTVADAAKYYGAAGLISGISIGDLTCNVSSIYGQIVPSTRTEFGLTDQQAGSGRTFTIDAGTRTPEVSTISESNLIQIVLANQALNYVDTLFPLPKEGTVVVTYQSQGNWYTIADKGDGTLSGNGAGTINYTTGSLLVTLQALPDTGSAIIIQWGTPVSWTKRAGDVAGKVQIKYTLSQGSCARNTFTATWDQNGVSKSVTDDGNGALTGDGVGTIRYSTGEVVIEPTHMPTPDSDITYDYSYGTPIIENFPLAGRDGNGKVNVTMTQTPALPNTVVLEWNTLLTIPPDTSVTSVAGLRQIDPDFKHNDNGSGGFEGDQMSEAIVDYNTGAIQFNPDKTVQYPVARYDWHTVKTEWVDIGGGQQEERKTRELRFQNLQYLNTPCIYPADGWVRVSYHTADGTNTQQDIDTSFDLYVDLQQTNGEDLVPNSLAITIGGVAMYDDGLGNIKRSSDELTIGTVNYQDNDMFLTGGWNFDAATTRSIQSMATWQTPYAVQGMVLRIPGQVVPGNMTISATALDGEALVATADLTGNMSGPDIFGWIDFNTGVCNLVFGTKILESTLTPAERLESWYDAANIDPDGYIVKPRLVDASTIRYNAVIYTYLPLDAEILGLNPVRLPVDGRVPIFRKADVVVVHQGETDTFSLNPVTSGGVESLPHTFVSNCRVKGQNSVIVSPYLYTNDNKLGNITMATWGTWQSEHTYVEGTLIKVAGNGHWYRVKVGGQSAVSEPSWYTDGTDTIDNTVEWEDLGGPTEPFIAEYRLENMMLVKNVDIGGVLTFTAPFSRDFDQAKAVVSSAAIFLDLQARVVNLFHQETWTDVWQDSRIGNPTIGKYNDVAYPIVVANDAAIKERWLIRFSSSTTFDVIGEVVGQIASGNTASTMAPVNQITGKPYFSIDYQGWGGGWSTGDCVRFNTEAAAAPLWLARCVETGEATKDSDDFKVQIRGDN